MASIQEQILQEVVELLDAAGKPTGLDVHDNATRPIWEEESNRAAVVYPQDVESEPDEQEDSTEDRMKIRVELRAATKQRDVRSCRLALDGLFIWTVKQLMANPDLGGLAMEVVRLGQSWDFVELKGAIYGGQAVDFEVVFNTQESNPEETG